MVEKPTEEQNTPQRIDDAAECAQGESAKEAKASQGGKERGKKNRKPLKDRIAIFSKKLVCSLKKCFTVKNIALALSGITLIHVGGSLIQCGIFFVGGYIAVVNESSSLPLPPEMQDMSLEDVVELWNDSYEHDWSKYNKQFVENMSKSVYGQTNYGQSTVMKVSNILSCEPVSRECNMRLSVYKNRNDDICKGYVQLKMEYPYYKDDEDMPFIQYDFYQVLGDDGFDLYFGFEGDWYYAKVSNNAETILNDSPDRYFDIFKEHTSIDIPLSPMICLPMSVLESVYPFNLYTPHECPDVIYAYSTMLFDDSDYIKGVVHGGFQNKINRNTFQKFVEQGDSAAAFFLDSYVAKGYVTTGFGDYGTIEEIIVPDEIVFQAKPFDDDIKSALCNDVIDFIEINQNEWKERFTYVSKNEKN